jgi:hypothetical protein
MMLHLTFSHRIDRDGSHESICTVCHMAVATAKTENELFRREFDHVCNPIQLFRLSSSNSNPQGAV